MNFVFCFRYRGGLDVTGGTTGKIYQTDKYRNNNYVILLGEHSVFRRFACSNETLEVFFKKKKLFSF